MSNKHLSNITTKVKNENQLNNSFGSLRLDEEWIKNVNFVNYSFLDLFLCYPLSVKTKLLI